MTGRLVAERRTRSAAEVPPTGEDAVCAGCRHHPHRPLRNPLMRAYERLRPPTTCQVWVDRTTWWDGELCRCPDPVHRS